MSVIESEDRAWVQISTPLSAPDLVTFCQDAERLLRINSHYEFLEWRNTDPQRAFMRLRNLSNNLVLETALHVEPRVDGIRLVYANGLKAATDFRVEPPPDGASSPGAVLIIVDDYSGSSEAARRARGAEVDRSLVPWGHDVRRYLRHWARWARFPWWRWYMRHVWQPMRPLGRRVTYLVIVLTLLEIVATLGVVALFVLGIVSFDN